MFVLSCGGIAAGCILYKLQPRSALNLVGNLPDVNTFSVSASDLVGISDIVLTLPGFMGAVNQSIKAGKAPPATSVIINVVYDDDWTAFGSDPNNTLPSARAKATRIVFKGFGMSGLFAEPVSCADSAVSCGVMSCPPDGRHD